MIAALIRRVAQTLAVLWLVTVITFLALRLTPGDPAVLLLGQGAGNEENAALLAQLRQEMGLDRPLVEQYFIWLGQVVRGQLGTSNQSGTPVLDIVIGAAPPTIWLIVLSMCVAIPVAVALGMTAAFSRRRLVDAVIRYLSSMAMATPGFWVGVLLIVVCCVHFNLLPATGYVAPEDSVVGFIAHMMLPVVTLSIYLVGVLTRFVYVEARAARGADFTRTAVAMGISARRTTWVYGLRNAVLPMITMVGVQMGILVGGAVLVEQVFGLGGAGQLMLEGVLNRDYPVVQGAVLLATTVVVLSTMAADVLRTVVDPRLR